MSDETLEQEEGPKQGEYADLSDRDEARRLLIAEYEQHKRHCIKRELAQGRQASRYMSMATRSLDRIASLFGLSTAQGLTEQQMAASIDKLFAIIARYVPEDRQAELREEIEHAQWSILNGDDDEEDDEDTDPATKKRASG